MHPSQRPSAVQSFRRATVRLAVIVLITYVVLVASLMLFEEKLVFFPSPYPEGDWNPAGLELEDAHFVAPDGVKLHGWYVPHEKARAVVLFAHGNGGNLAGRADVLRVLHADLRLSVMIFDYRGYGRSEGSPNEGGVLADARAARAWLAERADVPETEIVLLGRSLGGGVMVDLATSDGARGLILESTFTSLPDVAAGHYPWAPVNLLMRNRLDSLSKIGRYAGPLLQSHGTADQIIPYELGQQLFDAAETENKQFIALKNYGHNQMPPRRYYEQLDAWIEQLP